MTDGIALHGFPSLVFTESGFILGEDRRSAKHSGKEILSHFFREGFKKKNCEKAVRLTAWVQALTRVKKSKFESRKRNLKFWSRISRVEREIQDSDLEFRE